MHGASMTLRLALLSLVAEAQACSRFLFNRPGQPQLVGRSMDWAHPFDDRLFIVPRGIEMDGGVPGGAIWTIKYGSVVSAVSGYAHQFGYDWVKDGVTDGVNEAGLSAHALYLEQTVYPAVDERPAVGLFRWVSYILDNFATVEEALEGMKKVRIVGQTLGAGVMTLHLALEDASGDSALLEFLHGDLKVYHGRDTLVMTNEPPYLVQLANLKRYTGLGGKLPLPGSASSEDRFVRLSYYINYLPNVTNTPEGRVELAGNGRSLIMNAAVPFGAPYPNGPVGSPNDGGVYPTWWTSMVVKGVGELTYYFSWTRSPNVLWVDLTDIDFGPDNPVLQLNPQAIDLVGDITHQFGPVVVDAKPKGSTSQAQSLVSASPAASMTSSAGPASQTAGLVTLGFLTVLVAVGLLAHRKWASVQGPQVHTPLI